ncbi:MAG: VWA domain-containing protein, partial [Holophagales bacterium]|nr:VWA domain-containing protein [Holophagales bacterium]
MLLFLPAGGWGASGPPAELEPTEHGPAGPELSETPPSESETVSTIPEPELVGLAQIRHGSLLFVTSVAGMYLPAPGLETDVSIEVTGMVARTSVRQRFLNPHEGWVEGIYVFPLPENGAVDAMRMVIGERVIEGEIRERSDARRSYERAKAAGQRASLVEQERPNLFTTSVANLGPGEILDVVIEYQETLRYEAGRFELRFPMAVNPRYIPGRPLEPRSRMPSSARIGQEGAGDTPEPVPFSEHGWAYATHQVPDAGRITPPAVLPADGQIVNPVNLAVRLDPGFELEAVTSVSHRLRVERLDGTRHRVELEAGVVAANRDFVLSWQPVRGREPRAAFFAEKHGEHTYALMMVMPPHDRHAETRLPRETIFVFDKSGSMSGESMRQARRALFAALDRLSPEDHFNLVHFDSSAHRLFEGSVPADGSHLAIARRRIASLKANGGTEMLSALRLALESSELDLGLRQVIFVTDGSVGNEGELFSYIRSHLGRSRLFTVGIGS